MSQSISPVENPSRKRTARYSELAYTLFLQEKRAEIVLMQLEQYDATLNSPDNVNYRLIRLDQITAKVEQLWNALPKNEYDKYKAKAVLEFKRRRVMNTSPSPRSANDSSILEATRQIQLMDEFMIDITTFPNSTFHNGKQDWESDEIVHTLTTSNVDFLLNAFESPCSNLDESISASTIDNAKESLIRSQSPEGCHSKGYRNDHRDIHQPADFLTFARNDHRDIHWPADFLTYARIQIDTC